MLPILCKIRSCAISALRTLELRYLTSATYLIWNLLIVLCRLWSIFRFFYLLHDWCNICNIKFLVLLGVQLQHQTFVGHLHWPAVTCQAATHQCCSLSRRCSGTPPAANVNSNSCWLRWCTNAHLLRSSIGASQASTARPSRHKTITDHFLISPRLWKIGYQNHLGFDSGRSDLRNWGSIFLKWQTDPNKRIIWMFFMSFGYPFCREWYRKSLLKGSRWIVEPKWVNFLSQSEKLRLVLRRNGWVAVDYSWGNKLNLFFWELAICLTFQLKKYQVYLWRLFYEGWVSKEVTIVLVFVFLHCFDS